MRVKISIIAEDHDNRVKKSVDGALDIPPGTLQQGDVRDRVRSIAEWSLSQATGQITAHFGGPNPFRSSVRLRVVVAAEDHQAGLRATREDSVSIPENQLMEGNARDRVRSLAEWGLNTVAQCIGPQLGAHPAAPQGYPPQGGGYGGGDPIQSLITEKRARMGRGGPLHLPGSPEPAQAYGGWAPGQGAPPPYMGAGAPQKGTPAPLDPRRIPRDERQAVSMASEGLRRAVIDDKRKGPDFIVGEKNQPVKVNRHVGWGRHRHAKSGQRLR